MDEPIGCRVDWFSLINKNRGDDVTLHVQSDVHVGFYQSNG